MPEQIYPEPTVGGLVFNQNGEIFLMRSHKWRDIYTVPGGHIELGERMEDALRREIREETGLEIYDIRFLAFQEFIYDPAFWKRRHYVFFDYVCRTGSSDVTLNEEAESYVWASIEEALALPVEPYTRKTIEMYLEQSAPSA